jgi:hypothetical protein
VISDRGFLAFGVRLLTDLLTSSNACDLSPAEIAILDGP